MQLIVTMDYTPLFTPLLQLNHKGFLNLSNNKQSTGL